MKKTHIICGGILLTLGATFSSFSLLKNTILFNSMAGSQKYTITLDSGNAYTSGPSQLISTDSGASSVAFQYTDCSSSSGYHVNLNAGGSLKNTMQVTSIEKIKAIYEGALTFRYSYDGNAWTDYYSMSSNEEYTLNSHPYYFEIKASEITKLSSIKLTYTCLDNGLNIGGTKQTYYEKVTEEPSSWEGQYLIVYETSNWCFDGSLSTLDATNNYADVTISDNKILSTDTVDNYSFTVEEKFDGEYPYAITSASGNTIGTTSYNNSLKTGSNLACDLICEDGRAKCISEDDCLLSFNSAANQRRFRFYTSSNQKAVEFYKKVEATTPIPKDLMGLSLSKTTAEVSPGKSVTLKATFNPIDIDDDQKGLTWASSDTSIATVDANGKVTVSSSASFESTVTITATSTVKPNLSASCTITVKDIPTDEWTILLYSCGADLESGTSYQQYLDDPDDQYYYEYLDCYENGSGEASADISEILSVPNQPNNVNIVIETGGATKWREKDYGYGISAENIQRWHVENQQLVLDDTLPQANMGESSTLQSFLEWGIQTYPAEKIGLILWNHGGGMRGVCYDENYQDDPLYNSELNAALSNSFATLNRTEKLEFIGYDACLMQVQDIAETNSYFANYMIGSEESEAGFGWDYDSWVDDLYALNETETILKEICDSFIATVDQEYGSSDNNQTLSYLTLANVGAYKTAWENMTKVLKTKVASQGSGKFKTLIGTVKHYGGSDYDYFGTFDALDLLNKLSASSTLNPGNSYIDTCKAAFNNLVTYSVCGQVAGNSNGLAVYYSYSSDYSGVSGSYLCYDAEETNFSEWLSFNQTYGY